MGRCTASSRSGLPQWKVIRRTDRAGAFLSVRDQTGRVAMRKSQRRARKRAIAEIQSHPSNNMREEKIANPLQVIEALGPILGVDARSLNAWRDAALETGRSWTDVVLEQLVMNAARSQGSAEIFGADSLPSDLPSDEKRAVTSSIYRLAVTFDRIKQRDQDFDFDAALRFVTFCVDQVGRKLKEGGEAAVLRALEAAEIPGGAPPEFSPHGAAA